MQMIKPSAFALRAVAIFMVCAAAFQPNAATAQSPEAFYKGKTLTLLVGFTTGSGADSYARLVGRHIGRFLPGAPAVIIQNMPGSGSLTMANYLYSVAPKDGSTIGIFNRNVPMEPLMGNKNARFDAKQFTWIGSTNAEPSLCVAWHAAPVKKWEDAKERTFLVAATGLNANSGLVPMLLNEVLGTKMKTIMGYPGSGEMSLALEGGEVEGRCGWSRSSIMATRADWIAQDKIRLLLQAGLQKSPSMQDVPLAMDYVTNDSDRQLLKLGVAWDEMAWPFMAPPGVPPDRARALRSAFEAALRDPQLLEEARKERLDINLVTGEAIETLLADIYATPPDVVAKMSRLMGITR